MKAGWKNTVIAESEKTEVVEGNHYFPADSIKKQYFKESPTTSHCPWKGEASYFTVDVNGEENKDAAWYYAAPKEKAANIKGHVAFWKGVQVS